MGDGNLLVGYIPQNTTLGTPSGIDGTITIKAYIDKDKIAISDTYDGNESDNMGTTTEWVDERIVLTTDEWNAFQDSGISFQIKVEANEDIWVEETLYDIVERQTVMDNINSTYVNNTTPGIDFSQISSDTNGKGVYTFSSTTNDAYPVMYYRGDVKNNNVLFANKCWKMVRTTDTGGVKLIYNGEPTYNKTYLNESDYGNILTNTGDFTYDSSINAWETSLNTTLSSDNTKEISFNISETGDYVIELNGEMKIGCYIKVGIFVNSTLIKSVRFTSSYSYADTLNSLTQGDEVKIIYIGRATATKPVTIEISMKKFDSTIGTGCDNINKQSVIEVLGEQEFIYSNSNYVTDSPEYVGYMYGNIYEYENSPAVSGAYFGSEFTYNNGVYSLIDAKLGIDNHHHYTCNLTDANGTCSSIRYYMTYYSSGDRHFDIYFSLTNGKSIQNILEEMILNANSSNAKQIVDTWYEEILNNTTYSEKIEDTIYCNDRSVYNLGGFNPNGGTLNDVESTAYLYAGYNRAKDRYNPRITCLKKNDSFTVSSSKGNGVLNYPIGLITIDELIIAGGKINISNKNFYLNNFGDYYTMTPYNYLPDGESLIFIMMSGLIRNSSPNTSSGLRPVISIKNGTAIVDNDADGTVSNPYIIKK